MFKFGIPLEIKKFHQCLKFYSFILIILLVNESALRLQGWNNVCCCPCMWLLSSARTFGLHDSVRFKKQDSIENIIKPRDHLPMPNRKAHKIVPL